MIPAVAEYIKGKAPKTCRPTIEFLFILFFFDAAAAVAFQPQHTIELVEENKNPKRSNSRNCIHYIKLHNDLAE